MGIDLSKRIAKNKSSKKQKNSIEFSGLFYGGFTDKMKESFYKEFSILIRSGIGFEQSFDILIKQQQKQKAKILLKSIRDEIITGKGLSEAMEISGQFSKYEYYSVKIGEETKRLEKVFESLHLFFERKIKMKRQLISVFTYPAFVIIITGLVLFFMLNNVVPMFESVFKQFGGELPGITKFVILLSKKMPLFIIVTGIFIVAVISIHHLQKEKPHYRKFVTSLILSAPIFGKIVKKIYLARFTQSMSLLLEVKTPLVQSLSLTNQMIKFFPIEIAIKEMKASIMKGETLGKAMEKHRIFNHKIVSLITIGEEVNKLDMMFHNLTKQYNEEIEYETKLIGVILEPLIIIFIGLVVGFILISMYSPMFNLSKILSQ